MADMATTAVFFGAFLVLFCAFGAVAERIIDRRHQRQASRRMVARIRRYHA